MIRTVSTLLILVASVRLADATIDFTPVVREYTSQGIVYQRVTLNTDKQVITFTPPFGWNVSGSAGGLQLSPRSTKFVQASITSVDLEAPQAFDDRTIVALEQRVIASTPASNPPAQIIRRQENAVAISGNPSYQFVVAYNALGQAFQKSVIFVVTPDARLMFQLTAPKADFAGMEQSFRSSLASWQWADRKSAVPVSTKLTNSVAP